MNRAEAFLLDQVPVAQRSLIPATLKLAYSAAQAHIQDTPFLNVPSVQPGRIIQWAVDFGFNGLVESGQFAVDRRWRFFEKPTGKYLEIHFSHSVMTISQVADPVKQPRDVVFRANKRLSAQSWLRNLPNPDDPGIAAGMPHILLVHGHQDLNFAQLGIPNEDHSEGYIYRTSNLMRLPHELAAPEPPAEETDIDAVMTLKEEIDKWRKDNGTE